MFGSAGGTRTPPRGPGWSRAGGGGGGGGGGGATGGIWNSGWFSLRCSITLLTTSSVITLVSSRPPRKAAPTCLVSTACFSSRPSPANIWSELSPADEKEVGEEKDRGEGFRFSTSENVDWTDKSSSGELLISCCISSFVSNCVCFPLLLLSPRKLLLLVLSDWSKFDRRASSLSWSSLTEVVGLFPSSETALTGRGVSLLKFLSRDIKSVSRSPPRTSLCRLGAVNRLWDWRVCSLGTAPLFVWKSRFAVPLKAERSST